MSPFRAWLIRKLGPDHALVELTTCPWCMSIWTATGITTAAWFGAGTSWFTFPALILTVSHLYSLTAQHLDNN